MYWFSFCSSFITEFLKENGLLDVNLKLFTVLNRVLHIILWGPNHTSFDFNETTLIDFPESWLRLDLNYCRGIESIMSILMQFSISFKSYKSALLWAWSCYTEWWIVGLEKPPEVAESNHPPALNPSVTSKDGDTATALGILFQCSIILSMKIFFPIANLSLLWNNLKPHTLFPSLNFEIILRLTLPGYKLLSGSCREQWGLPWAFFSPGKTSWAALPHIWAPGPSQLCCPLATLQHLSVCLAAPTICRALWGAFRKALLEQTLKAKNIYTFFNYKFCCWSSCSCCCVTEECGSWVCGSGCTGSFGWNSRG